MVPRGRPTTSGSGGRSGQRRSALLPANRAWERPVSGQFGLVMTVGPGRFVRSVHRASRPLEHPLPGRQRAIGAGAGCNSWTFPASLWLRQATAFRRPPSGECRSRPERPWASALPLPSVGRPLRADVVHVVFASGGLEASLVQRIGRSAPFGSPEMTGTTRVASPLSRMGAITSSTPSV